MKNIVLSLAHAVCACAVSAALLSGCSSPQIAPSLGNGAAADGARNALPLSSSMWSVIDSPNEPPNTDGLYDDTLSSVSGTSPSDVWAVGNDCCYLNGSQEYTHSLIEHWNGSAWAIVPFAKNEPADSLLHAVAAISPTDAWAVGNAPFPNNQALIEHWNGKKWSVVTSPVVYNNAELLSVVAISPNNVWAAGEGNFAALLEHWDGQAWSFVPGLTMGGLTILTSIAATGPNDIMAVGTYSSPNLNLFAEHWNGTTWANANPAGKFFQGDYASVKATSPNHYWAVGWEEANEHSQVPQTLTEYWSGAQFKVVASPNKNPQGSLLLNQLTSVAALSPHDLWAVGLWTWYPGSGTTRSLFEHWNGKAWKTEPGPAALESSNNLTFNELLGVAEVGHGVLWGVGSRNSAPRSSEQGDVTLTVEAAHR